MKQAQFRSPWLPYLLLLPQMVIVVVFFYWPAVEAVRSSFYLEDPFGFSSTFVGLDNFKDVVSRSDYLRTVKFTAFFTVIVSFFSLAIALLLAVKANKVIRAASTYKTLLMWVYAIAAPVAGLIGIFLFDQSFGALTHLAARVGWEFTLGVDNFDTAAAMIIISVWKQIPVNFIFFLSGLQGIPKSVQEAAAIDCVSKVRRFWTITFPLLAPTGFFLLIINITYALFDTFGVIDIVLKGEPGNNPITLVYKVFLDGFRGNDLGGSSAQSVILMILVTLLTIFQFRMIDRKVHYN